MTVQELINELQKVSDKNISVGILHEELRQGSSWTGTYSAGESCIDIDEVKLVSADVFAGLNDMDKVDHVEIISEELKEK